MLLRALRWALAGASLLLLHAPTAAVAADQLNGWYPCAEYTFESDGSSIGAAECAIMNAPLCHEDVCEAAANATVEIFFKRILGVEAGLPNVWFLQGGPGASSTAMESAMIMMYNQMQGLVNVYTMDHRGTGRSTLFDCVAAQSTVSGSPGGGYVSVSEVSACAAALEDKYGSDLSSFSVTSAAWDVATFISTFTPDEQTFVYGVSYGTALVERLMHLAPDEIVGFIMDGIATASGSALANVEYFSKWDSDYGEVADGFLAQCAADAFCGAKFADQSLPDTLVSLVESFDNDPDSTCAALVRDLTSGISGYAVEPASYTLRKLLGSLFMDADSRTLIPTLAYRLARCSADDVDVLTYFLSPKEAQTTSGYSEDEKFESTLLYGLIVYSEMWESPQPSDAVMLQRFTDYTVTNGGTYDSVGQYCAFSKEQSAVCSTYGGGSYDASGIVYEKDAYWNEAAEIPSQASVLLMSSKMDPQTPHKYAEFLLEALDGDAKELVTFEHATHGTLWTTPLSEFSSETCGLLILASYVSEGGDLSAMDKSCLNLLPDLSFEVPDMYTAYYLSTDDAYDGAFDASYGAAVVGSSSSSSAGLTGSSSTSEEASTGSGDSSSTYKTLFVVFLVLFVLAAVAAAVFAVRWCRRRRRDAAKPSELPTQAAAFQTPAQGSSQPFVGIQGGRYAGQ